MELYGQWGLVSLVESGVAAGNIEILNIGSNVIRIQPDTFNFGHPAKI